MSAHILPRLLLFALLAAGLPAARATERPYEEGAKQHSWLSWNRPAEKTPAAQLARAERFRAGNRLKKAQKAYRALVVTWPGSAQAPAAQLGYAEMLDRRGDEEKAFEQYDLLMTRFIGDFPYDRVLQRQFEIGKAMMDRRRGRLLFFGGFQAPERAIPIFESVLKNGPQAPFAPEAQYLIGQAYELSEQLELAVVAYMTAQHRYPDSPFAEKASLGRARALYRLSEDSPNDEEALEQAWAGTVLFLNRFPDSPDREVATVYRDNLLRRRARASYNKALFYDRVAHKPAAALHAYETFVKAFPNSEWTALARARMDELNKTVEKKHEDEHRQD